MSRLRLPAALAFVTLGGAAAIGAVAGCGTQSSTCEIYCIAVAQDAGSAGSAGSGSDAGPPTCPVCADSHGQCPAPCEPIG